MRQSWIIAGLIALPTLGALASHAMADVLGRRVGRSLAALTPKPVARVVSATTKSASRTMRTTAEHRHQSQLAEAPSTERAPGARMRDPQPVAVKSAAHRVPSKGVFVSARRVLQIARSGQRPGGSQVAAGPGRPAGVRLTGVGALGVGLRDGDVLTHAAGAPASEGQVIGAVVRAHARKAKSMSGRIWRDGEFLNLTVELPYPKSWGVQRRKRSRKTGQRTALRRAVTRR